MGAGRSRSRILLAMAERLFPTRAASFSCVTPRSSSSTFRAKASSTGLSCWRTTFSTRASSRLSTSEAARTMAGTTVNPAC